MMTMMNDDDDDDYDDDDDDNDNYDDDGDDDDDDVASNDDASDTITMTDLQEACMDCNFVKEEMQYWLIKTIKNQNLYESR